MYPRLKQFALFGMAVASALFLLGLITAVHAQGTPRPSSPQPSPSDKHDDDVDFAMRETDARTRLILKAEKKAYEEHVARAKEASDIAAQLKTNYEAANVFNAADHKKLERLEKLARRIRNDVGGSETNSDPKDLPKTTSEAVSLLADQAKELYAEVEKTPRRVVSTSIIDQANKLITLIQYVRDTRH